MSRKKYHADDEETFVGMKIVGNIGSSHKVLPWEGDRTSYDRVKLYPVFCDICNNNPLFESNRFLIRKSDALCGYTPCACSSNFSLTKYQLEGLVLEYCTNIGKELISINDLPEKAPSKWKLDIFCSKHNFTTKTYTWTSLKKSMYGCKLCANEGVKASKIKSTEYFLKSFDLPPHVTVFNDNNTTDSQGQHLYWYLICDKCSYDKYVQAGICTGTFRTTRGQLQKGSLPCRCSPTYPVVFERAIYDIEDVCKDKGYQFKGYKEGFDNISKAKFEYICSAGHLNISHHHKFCNRGYGCSKCLGFGYYKERSSQADTLYIILLTSNEEIFIKVGRSFDHRSRCLEYSRAGYSVEVLYLIKGNHKTIYTLEQSCHAHIGVFHYTPSLAFAGSVRECFTETGLKELLIHIRTLGFTLHKGTDE